MAALGWPAAVVFDLDGTLVDSAPDIASALNAAMQPYALSPFTVGDVHGMIGAGSFVLVQRAIAAKGVVLDASEQARLFSRFMGFYQEISAEGAGLYFGAVDLLRDLRAAGTRLALCTNKPADVTDIAIDALGIAAYFDCVVGGRDDLPKKPAPDMLLAALAGIGVAPAGAVMIGDSAADVGAARAAGVRVLVARSGYSKTPADQLGADAVYDRLADVPRLMAALRG